MKKNLMRLLSLALCLLMLCPTALAQGSYKIGEPTQEIVGKALMTGKMLNASVKLGLDVDPAVFGLSAEEAEMVLGLLEQATLTGGFALLKDGVRIQLAGEMASKTSNQTVAVTGAADVTLDGLSLETNLLSGRRVTVKWETLLTLAGLGAQEISTFSAVRDMARGKTIGEIVGMLEAAAGEAAAQILPVAQALMQMAEPYVTIASDWVFTLPMEVNENLNEEGYPPTATEIAFAVTLKDVGNLLTKITDQFEQDTVLQQYIVTLFTQMGEQITAADLVSELRYSAAQLTDESIPAYIYLGMNEYGTPLYLEVVVNEPESGESFYTGAFFYEDAQDGNTLSFVVGVYDAQGNAIASIYAGGNHLADPSDVNVHNVEVAFGGMADDGTVVDMIYNYNVARDTGSELPTYNMTNSYTMYVNDGVDIIEMGSYGEGSMGQNVKGEFAKGTSVVQANVDGEQMSITAAVDMALADVGVADFSGHYHVTESMPAAGINALDLNASVYTSSYHPELSAALQVIELEKMSNDDMNALVNEINDALMNQKMIELMQVLPTEVVQQLAQ